MGTKWHITSLNWKNKDHIVYPSHRGSLNDNVIDRWLVPVKTLGTNPIKFTKRIKKKNVKNRGSVPGKITGPKTARNSDPT